MRFTAHLGPRSGPQHHLSRSHGSRVPCERQRSTLGPTEAAHALARPHHRRLMPKLIVAARVGGTERPATQREVCQHWMVPKMVWCGGKQARRCAFGCGHSDWVPTVTTLSGHPG